MTRKLMLVLAVGLVLAPVAEAKGPHAVLSSGPEALKPGRTWVATLELNEFRRAAHPVVVATRGDHQVTAQLRRVSASMPGAAGFKLRMVLPSEGRWRVAVAAGKRHFSFPALVVGGADAPQDWVAFPKGSAAARHGAGGAWSQGPEGDASGRAEPLPPETVAIREPADDDDDGIPFWIPALGLALAGAGVGLGVAHRR